MYVSWNTCGGQKTLRGILSLLLSCGSRDQTQAIRLGDKCFYLLYHLALGFTKESASPAFSRTPGDPRSGQAQGCLAGAPSSCSPLSPRWDSEYLSVPHVHSVISTPGTIGRLWDLEEVALVEGRRGHQGRVPMRGCRVLDVPLPLLIAPGLLQGI